MRSILLDRTTWDFVLDANGNLATCTDGYAVLQDVATAVRLWSAECWYDTTLGVAYDGGVFTDASTIPALKTQIETAAMSVPGVAEAQCALLGPRRDRSLGGVIAVTFTSGGSASVQF